MNDSNDVKQLYRTYRSIPQPILLLIAAELLIQFVNAGFFLILNLYLRNEGLSDAEIAAYTSHRFLAVLLFAVPLGVFIKGKKLKPFMLVGTILFPITSYLFLYAIEHDMPELARYAFFGWGTALMLVQVCALPFIMRYTDPETESEAISLNYTTFAFGTIASGTVIWMLSDVVKDLFPQRTHVEYPILLALVLVSVFAPFLLLLVREPRPVKEAGDLPLSFNRLKEYDWKIIIRAVVPTAIIAIGAGLTIPFINLFFNGVFGIDSGKMSTIGALTSVLVVIASLLVPGIRKRAGYKWAITVSQTFAVAFLYLMSVTELFAEYRWALWLAVGSYMLRTPLMNMAGPMTSELVMNYVGPKNQELVSAIVSSIWSGSWFISAKGFQVFRAFGLPYWQIFLMTAVLYSFGVFLYFMLIRDHERRLKETG